ncbi:MAG: Holliday junction resolvase RuvX, partial [Aureliella sp.]
GQEQLVGWIVGLPIHCSGDESQKSAEARQFAAWLGERTGLPVALFDERFTTAEARQLLNETDLSPKKRRQRLDGMAAHLILSHYLGARGSGASVSAPLDDPANSG